MSRDETKFLKFNYVFVQCFTTTILFGNASQQNIFAFWHTAALVCALNTWNNFFEMFLSFCYYVEIDLKY